MNWDMWEQDAKGRILKALDAADQYLTCADAAREIGDEDGAVVYLTLRDVAFRGAKDDETLLQRIDIDRQIEDLHRKLDELWVERREAAAIGEALHRANVEALRSLGSDIEG